MKNISNAEINLRGFVIWRVKRGEGASETAQFFTNFKERSVLLWSTSFKNIANPQSKVGMFCETEQNGK